MLKVYCYSKCTTCNKALKWLDDCEEASSGWRRFRADRVQRS